MLRVLIVDDSPLIGEILKSMLEDAPDIQVVGQAMNGQEALRMVLRLMPDVITMDIRMPKMDGLEATRRIMSLRPTPIIVLSSTVYATDYNVAFSAIQAGALSVIEKPKGMMGQDFDEVKTQLLTTIRTMSGVKLVSRHDNRPRQNGIGPMTAMLHDYFTRRIQVVAIASSTGGPPVLMDIFSRLPKDFSMPIVVVQHILPPFLDCMVEWLGGKSNLPVAVAKEGDRLFPGKILIAPGDKHLGVTAGGTVFISSADPIKSQRPSATFLFDSVASAFSNSSVGVILTGMGDDGADGLEKLSKAGGHVIAQDEASSVVFGMPKAAIDRGIVDEVMSPEEIAVRMIKLHHHMKTNLQ